MIIAVAALVLYQSALDNALDGGALKGALAGTCVIGLDGREIYGRHADVRLVPASNQKILTAVYATSTLGLEFRPQTRFWKEKNYLYVDASGDPTISYQRLLDVRKRLDLGTDIAVYVRQAYRPIVPPSWEYDDLPNRYAARVTALSFDRGGFEVWAEGGKLRELDPAYRIKFRHVPGSERATVDYSAESRIAIVTGTLSDEARMIEAFAMPDPDVIAARLLGGTIVHTSGAPPDRKPDFVLEGPTLREILKDCLEKSDNNLAEHLLLMAATTTKPLGRNAYADAADRMQNFFFEIVGLKEGSIKAIDGSGMSRHNLVTPRAMCQVLAWAYKQPWRGDFIVALAAGGEGTLQSRLGSSSFFGKTGTLSAVTCLSGYIKPGSSQTKIVSMLFNNTIAPASEVRAVQDRVVTILDRGS